MTQDTHENQFINKEFETAIPDKSLFQGETGASIGGTDGVIAGTAMALAH